FVGCGSEYALGNLGAETSDEIFLQRIKITVGLDRRSQICKQVAEALQVFMAWKFAQVRVKCAVIELSPNIIATDIFPHSFQDVPSLAIQDLVKERVPPRHAGFDEKVNADINQTIGGARAREQATDILLLLH